METCCVVFKDLTDDAHQTKCDAGDDQTLAGFSLKATGLDSAVIRQYLPSWRLQPSVREIESGNKANRISCHSEALLIVVGFVHVVVQLC